jgi:hypothetical protein
MDSARGARLFVSTYLPSAVTKISRPAGVAYQNREAAAEPLDRDLEGPFVAFWERPGRRSEGQFFVVQSATGECQIIGGRAAAVDGESTGLTRQFSCRTV